MSILERRAPWIAVAVFAVFLGMLGGCGGGGGTNPTPVAAATPLPCTQSTLGQASGPIPAGFVGALPIPTTVAGRIDATVDWTFATSSIGVYVVQVSTGCNVEQINTCTIIAASNPSTVKPRKLSVTAPAGSYQLLILNNAAVDESVTIGVVLSLGSCPAFG